MDSTSHRLKFGLSGLGTQSIEDSRAGYQRETRLMLRLAQEAEASGFDSVWVTEHHVAADGYLPSPLVALGAIAAMTDRVSLGTNIALAPLAHPVRLAEDAAVLDQICAGRLILGLGLGYRPEEFAAFGVDATKRVSIMRDTIGMLRRAWRGEPLTVGPGTDVPVRPLPYREGGPPLWLGGWVEPAVRRARRLGDGYIAPVGTPKDIAYRLNWLAEEGALFGFPVAVSVNGFVGGSDVWQAVAGGVNHVLLQYQRWYGDSDDPVQTGRGRISGEVDGAPPRHFVVGSPQACVEMLTTLCDALVLRPDVEAHVLVRLSFPGVSESDAARSVRLFGTEVIPALRARVAAT